MKILKSSNKNFINNLNKILSKRGENLHNNIDKAVKNILKEVKNYGDEALIKYSKKFDKIDLKIEDLLLQKKVRNSYKKNINQKIFNSFLKTIHNVKKFHNLQKPKDYELSSNGVKIKSRWNPIDSVGLYIPGGKHVYPSSFIMNVVPAVIAGVKRIVCVTPPSKIINPYISALFDQFQIQEVYQIGGPQAIAALAFGTETIKPVNKIFGPGNHYVTSAKKQVFGKVGIDLIAGPSEIVVVANESNNPSWVATDLIAQAEHDINAQSILITNSNKFAQKVIEQINIFKKKLPKENTISKSLKNNGIVIFVKNILESIDIINNIAPEHLHLHVKEKVRILKNISNAGCIFMGEYSTEAFGDYIVGSNHILPTFGSSKYSSGLGVLDFMKRNSIVQITSKGYKKNQNDVQQMAAVEGLYAHKLSVKIRQN